MIFQHVLLCLYSLGLKYGFSRTNTFRSEYWTFSPNMNSLVISEYNLNLVRKYYPFPLFSGQHTTRILWFLHEFIFFFPAHSLTITLASNIPQGGMYVITSTLFFRHGFVFRIIKFGCNIRQLNFPICLQTAKRGSSRQWSYKYLL